MILVTGGAGFIGSHLVEALLKKGHGVRVLDNLCTGKLENLAEATGFPLEELTGLSEHSAPFPLGKKAEFLWGDIGNVDTCRTACRGISFVFHLAALGSVPRSVEDPIASHRANATGTLHMLLAAKEAKVQRVIYASSSSVYGNISSNLREGVPKSETLSPHPQSPYAATKLMGEQYCRIFTELYGLETVSLRYFNVFGPRQDPQSIYAAVIPKFITALRRGSSPIIYGDGQQSRDFTYVANVVRANLLAMRTPGIAGKAFNIACGRQITINQLLSSLQEISGRSIGPQYQPGRRGEVRHSRASIDLAKAHLGYAVEVGFEEGLEATWHWFSQKA